jgi:hypothetical protein
MARQQLIASTLLFHSSSATQSPPSRLSFPISCHVQALAARAGSRGALEHHQTAAVEQINNRGPEASNHWKFLHTDNIAASNIDLDIDTACSVSNIS